MCGALSAAPHADPPPSDGFGGTDGGSGQGVYPAALRGERPVGGKAVRVSAFKFHLFSTLFKRETGTSFTAYVTTVRMEAAAEAIRGTEEKTYLIAQRCGYEDPNYFSYVFKRHFGVTPTKYRSEGK